LDKLVIQYGGRIYLSKDARMKPDMFFNGYPNAERFISIIKTFNPGKFISLLSKRLQIRS